MNWNKVLKSKSSVVLRWIASYLIVLLLPVLLNIVLYSKSKTQIMEQTESSNNVVLESIRESIDNQLLFAEQLSLELVINNDILEIADYKPPLNAQEKFNIYAFTKSLSSLMLSSKEYIDDLFIYFEKIDTVVASDSSSNNSINYYNANFADSGLSYDRWKEFISSRYSGKYFKLDSQWNNSGTVLFLRTLPISAASNGVINVVLKIDSEKLLKPVKGLYLKEYGKFIILDENNNEIVSYSAAGEKGEARNSTPHKENESNMISISNTSSINGWRYTYLLPRDEIFKNLYSIRRLMILLFLLCGIGGVFLIFVFTKSNYRPLSSLMSLFKNEKGNQYFENEYLYLDDMIKKAIAEKVELSSRIVNQNLIIKSHILKKLLSGNPITETHEIRELKQLDIDLENGSFTVMLFRYDDCGDEECEEPYYVNTKNFIICNIVDELLQNNGFESYNTTVDENIAYLIRMTDGKSEDDISNSIYFAQDFIKYHFDFSFVCTISSVHQNQYGIAECYAEALDALDQNISAKKGIFKFKDLQKNLIGSYYYPLEKEQQLINCMKLGEKEKAINIIDEIFEKNFKEKEISKDMSRCLLLNLYSTLIKNFSSKEVELCEELGYESAIVKSIYNFTDLEEIKRIITSVFEAYCEQLKERVNNNESLSKRIIQYVEKNYMDPELNIANISHNLSLHPDYISRIFKEQTGQRLLNYINFLRIEKAKELLKNTDYSIAKISGLTGFSNYRTFERVFTKTVGVTAKQFRIIN